MAELDTRRSGLLRREIALLTGAIVLIGAALAGFSYSESTQKRSDDWLQSAQQIGTDALEIASAADAVTRGQTPDFALLVGRLEDFDYTLDTLREGDRETGTAPMPGFVATEVAAVGTAWETLSTSIQTVLAGESSLLSIQRESAAANAGLASIRTQYEQIAERLGQRPASATQTYLVAGQLIRIERLGRALETLLSSGRDAADRVASLQAESTTFLGNHAVLMGGGSDLPPLRDPALQALAADVQASYLPIAQQIETILLSAPAVNDLQQSAALMQGQAAEVLSAAKSLEQALVDRLGTSNTLPVLSAIALLLAIAAIVTFFLFFLRGMRQTSSVSQERDARQQQAILGLLDEITNLADGDLTVDVTVTEDFTGAIADSINYTVQNMRGLVGTINRTSEQLAESAVQTRDIATRMNQGSERQARDVTTITQQITATSQSLQQVAARAEQAAQQAEGSVAVARNGAQTVERTIQGMNALREQIQDTSKRIKRLGESSQEIGNIIELINDIAEQTGTLALNASIQAAMAGEQGRGFAVVAEEVQRLAERASTATRQIETLVKTIQADTNEAIVSMERSTVNVVGGAQNAEEAGGALTQVQASSQQIASLIQDIAGAARTQSASATQIAGQMQTIRAIAVQTSQSSSQTAGAVGELNTLAERMRASVSGFKLPDDA